MMTQKTLLMAGVGLALIGTAYGLWQWQKARIYEAASPPEKGWILVEERGCSGCHQAGNSFRAPELKDLYGQTVSLSDGTQKVVDASYLRTSLLQPKIHVRLGYQAVMPSYEGRLSPEEIDSLLAAMGVPAESR